MDYSEDIPKNEVAEAIRRVRGGELDAYGELVRRFQGNLLGYAINRLGDVDAAKEVVQLTFIRAYEQIAEFRDDGDFGVWLGVICKSFVLTELTRRRREHQNRESYESVFEFDRAERLAAEAERQAPPLHDHRSILKDCLKKLGKEPASLIHLRYVEGRKCREIAEQKERSLTWVTSTLGRVRNSLRNCVNSRLEELRG